jgi:deoxyribodipyrimidine photo-lyase
MATAPRVLVYLLRRDLRLSDNPVLHEAANTFAEHHEFTHLLPIYVFAAQQVEVSGFLRASDSEKQLKSPYPEARSRVAGFWRCGPHRAKFLAESVWDVKESLEGAGSGLVIRAGLLADVVADLFTFYASRDAEVHGVWMTAEVADEEVKEERQVRDVVEQHGKEFRLFADEKYYIDE